MSVDCHANSTAISKSFNQQKNLTLTYLATTIGLYIDKVNKEGVCTAECCLTPEILQCIYLSQVVALGIVQNSSFSEKWRVHVSSLTVIRADLGLYLLL